MNCPRNLLEQILDCASELEDVMAHSSCVGQVSDFSLN
jgi:hypothetical protein